MGGSKKNGDSTSMLIETPPTDEVFLPLQVLDSANAFVPHPSASNSANYQPNYPDANIQVDAYETILGAWNDYENLAPADVVTYEAGSQISAYTQPVAMNRTASDACVCFGCQKNNPILEHNYITCPELISHLKLYPIPNDPTRKDYIDLATSKPDRKIYYVPPWIIPPNNQNLYRVPLELLQHKEFMSEMDESSFSALNEDSPEVFPLVTRDSLDFRYEIIRPLGSGWCGRVILAYDHKNRLHVAIKIHGRGGVRAEAALNEIKLLIKIADKDTKNTSRIVRAISSFKHDGHNCLVTELLGPNLLDLIETAALDVHYSKIPNITEDAHIPPLSLSQIRCIAEQLFYSLVMLRKLKLVHGDIKPENVLTSNPQFTKKRRSLVIGDLKRQTNIDVKLIDFGTASYGADQKGMYLGTRFYRSPEVVWGSDVSTASDMWSLACVLAELYLGKPIFPARDENALIEMVAHVLGPPPRRLMNSALRKNELLAKFNLTKKISGRKKGKSAPPVMENVPNFQDDMTEEESDILTPFSNAGEEYPNQAIPIPPAQKSFFSLERYKNGANAGVKKMRSGSFKDEISDGLKKIYDFNEGDEPKTDRKRKKARILYNLRRILGEDVDPDFLDLLYRCLVYDPKKRPTPRQALRHPFIVSGPGTTKLTRKKTPTSVENGENLNILMRARSAPDIIDSPGVIEIANDNIPHPQKPSGGNFWGGKFKIIKSQKSSENLRSGYLPVDGPDGSLAKLRKAGTRSEEQIPHIDSPPLQEAKPEPEKSVSLWDLFRKLPKSKSAHSDRARKSLDANSSDQAVENGGEVSEKRKVLSLRKLSAGRKKDNKVGNSGVEEQPISKLGKLLTSSSANLSKSLKKSPSADLGKQNRGFTMPGLQRSVTQTAVSPRGKSWDGDDPTQASTPTSEMFDIKRFGSFISKNRRKPTSSTHKSASSSTKSVPFDTASSRASRKSAYSFVGSERESIIESSKYGLSKMNSESSMEYEGWADVIDFDEEYSEEELDYFDDGMETVDVDKNAVTKTNLLGNWNIRLTRPFGRPRQRTLE
ncbi:hypothetical protein HK098_005874 [Nowakowskiella sp. JEL0407]|nr:hypothetical protein HK098_005874 [Nowakowskiella sp. JEL0407]